MGAHFRYLVLLSLCLLPATQLFATDWATILPPQGEQTDPAQPVRTEHSLRVGELLTLPLPGSRSHSCPVELAGDAVKIVVHNPLTSVTLQGVKPGAATLRIFRKFWRDPDLPESYRLVEVVSIAVTSSFGKPFPPMKHEAKETVPVPTHSENLEWQGNLSLQEGELITVITDRHEWTALWRQAFAAPAPPIDFEKYGIACVFLGYHADWLYSIDFGKPRIENGLQVIPYDLAEIVLELSGPFRAAGQYRMKAFAREKGYGIALRRSSREAAN